LLDKLRIGDRQVSKSNLMSSRQSSHRNKDRVDSEVESKKYF
jgi:hypothetical protein